MNIKLTKVAKKVEKLVNAGEHPNDLVERKDEVGRWVSDFVTGSDDFFYALTNGYINYKSLIDDKEQLEEIEKAIKLLQQLETLTRELGIEC